MNFEKARQYVKDKVSPTASFLSQVLLNLLDALEDRPEKAREWPQFQVGDIVQVLNNIGIGIVSDTAGQAGRVHNINICDCIICVRFRGPICVEFRDKRSGDKRRLYFKETEIKLLYREPK